MTPKPLQPAERRSPEPLTICSFTCRLISSSPRPGMLWATTAPRNSSGELAHPMALWPSRARTSHLLKTDALSVFTFSLIPSRGEGGPPERFRPNSGHANRSPLSANRVSANTFRILRILYSRLRDKIRQYGLGLDNFLRRDLLSVANIQKCRENFRRIEVRYRDGTGWLGRQDSNLGMAESKSAALPLGYAPIPSDWRRPPGPAAQHSDGACAKQCSTRPPRYPRPPSAI